MPATATKTFIRAAAAAAMATAATAATAAAAAAQAAAVAAAKAAVLATAAAAAAAAHLHVVGDLAHLERGLGLGARRHDRPAQLLHATRLRTRGLALLRRAVAARKEHEARLVGFQALRVERQRLLAAVPPAMVDGNADCRRDLDGNARRLRARATRVLSQLGAMSGTSGYAGVAQQRVDESSCKPARADESRRRSTRERRRNGVA